jgi:hypothetical protein
LLIRFLRGQNVVIRIEILKKNIEF